MSSGSSNYLLPSVFQLIRREEARIENWRREVLLLPPGTLYITYKGNRAYFIRRLNGKYFGIKKDPALVPLLARKRYLSLLIEEHSRDLLLLRKGALPSQSGPSSLHKPKSEVFLDQCLFAGLPTTAITCSQEQRDWMNASFPANNHPFQGTTYKTYSGIVTRSKSEQQIGNALERYGVPYRYEQKYSFDVGFLDGIYGAAQGKYKNYCPDFTLRPAIRRYFYWEHLGRVDLPDYREHNKAPVFQRKHPR